MAKKNRCYLCGGRLLDGYCQDCGLDNMRNYRKHYHLNESDSVESINGDPGQASVKCDEKRGQPSENAGGQVLRPVEGALDGGDGTARQMQYAGRTPATPRQNTAGKVSMPRQVLRNGQRYPAPQAPASGKVKIAVAVIGLIAALGFFLSDNRQKYDMGGTPEFEEEFVSDSGLEDNPAYEFAKRELSESGEEFETELGQGEYLVGVHLPEGVYTADLQEGSGNFSVDDLENGIYLWQSFGTDTEYDEAESMEDIRLYQGARIQITDGVVLRMRTENGQTEQLEAIDNPLTESVSLKKDQTMAVGEDCPAGVYDLSAKDKGTWALLRCTIPDESYEEGYYETTYWLSGEEWDDLYRNIYLREGVEITAEESPLVLTPSETVGAGDYEEYYKHY